MRREVEIRGDISEAGSSWSRPWINSNTTTSHTHTHTHTHKVKGGDVLPWDFRGIQSPLATQPASTHCTPEPQIMVRPCLETQRQQPLSVVTSHTGAANLALACFRQPQLQIRGGGHHATFFPSTEDTSDQSLNMFFRHICIQSHLRAISLKSQFTWGHRLSLSKWSVTQVYGDLSLE